MADGVKQAEARLRLQVVLLDIRSQGCPLARGTLMQIRLNYSCHMQTHRFTAAPGQR